MYPCIMIDQEPNQDGKLLEWALIPKDQSGEKVVRGFIGVEDVDGCHAVPFLPGYGAARTVISWYERGGK